MKTRAVALLTLSSALLIGCGPYTKPKILEPLAAFDNTSVSANILNVGAGSCQIIECVDERAPIMLDCGTTVFAKGAGKAKIQGEVSELLERHGNRVRLVISQPEDDHTNLLNNVLEGVEIESIHYAGRRQLLPSEILAHPKLPEALSQPWEGWNFDGTQPFEPLACGNGPTHVVAANSAYRYAPRDNKRHSLALMVEHEGQRMLFSGDAIGHTQDKIIQTLDTLNVKEPLAALVAPAHGATERGSNEAQWGERINPQTVIYSAGRLHGQPRCEAIGVYKSLAAAQVHPFECADKGVAMVRVMEESPHAQSDAHNEQGASTTAVAEYNTELNGSVRVSLTPKGLSISCRYQANCGLQ